MADIEKVKQGLKAHTDECAWVCNENCPYYEPSEYGCCDNLIEDALSVIEGQQAEIEKLQPKKGKWLEYAGDQKCSVCGSSYSDLHPEYSRTPFCPHCGAKMEEGEGE